MVEIVPLTVVGGETPLESANYGENKSITFR